MLLQLTQIPIVLKRPCFTWIKYDILRLRYSTKRVQLLMEFFFFLIPWIYLEQQNLQVFIVRLCNLEALTGGVDLHLAQDVLKIIGRLLYRM
jgi:hypothetical protein